MAASVLDGRDLVALDVGAARGLLPHWEPLASFASLVLVEPDVTAVPLIRERLEALGSKHFHILPYGLSDTGGTKTLHQIAFRTSSSLLPLNLPQALDYSHREWIFPQSEIQIETRVLGEVLDEHVIPRVDMIKLDTQGTELAILSGLGSRSDSLLSLEIEVGISENYVGQAKLADVLSFAERHGLELIDLTPKRATMVHDGNPGFYEELFGTYRRSPSLGVRLVEIDALFMRKHGLVLADRDPAQVRRLIAVLGLHGKFAQAHRLAELASNEGILTVTEFESIATALVACHRQAFVRRVAVDVAEKVVQKFGARLSPVR